MASSQSVLSETLQSITLTKIHELEKQKEAYSFRKGQILQSAQGHSEHVRERISILLKGVENLTDSNNVHVKNELHNVRRWLDQSVYDSSVPEAKLLAFEQRLRSRLDTGTRKLDLAHLYSRLLTEWISTTSANTDPDEVEGSGSDDSFEMVKDSQKARLEQLRDKFARVVFEPLETSERAIENYLTQLFPGDHGAKTLAILREDVASFGKSMLSDTYRLDEQTLRWCVKALLKNELLNDEKKASLNEFLKDDAVMAEIRDVLNMRYRDLKDWDWNLEDGMPVLPRQSLNGKWRVMMDEDVLQALLTHWIGTSWAVRMKQSLNGTRRSTQLWQKYTRLPDDERAKRQYYLERYLYDSMISDKNVAHERQSVYQDDFFMSPLPSKMFEEAGGYDDDDDVPDGDRKSPKEIKQLLLRTLATEVIVRKSLDGEVAVVQSDFQWFATGIAHSTVFAIMRFLGFQEEWIEFFKKVLEPPLNMMDGSPVQKRKRGLPMAHVFEKLLGELVLYFMDLAVAQNDGTILYRFHDDLWLAGKPKQCAAAWQTMEEFAKVMGLEFNKNKTGSVYLTDGKHKRDTKVEKALPEGPVAMNFLVLDAHSGKWIINKDHVEEHVAQLQKQLAESSSVLQWIKTWNSCIGRFFSYTFGEPAHCFGRDHLDEILKTHRDMQRQMFNDNETGTTVAAYVRHMLTTRFEIDDIPESFLFIPESLGGLGLKNPFVPLLLRRENVCKDPDARMQAFCEWERNQYQTAKKNFEALSERERRKRYKAAFQTGEYEDVKPPIAWDDAQSFMTFEDYTKFRDCTSRGLYDVYTYFLKEPKEDGVAKMNSVKYWMQALKTSPELDAELAWNLHFFEDELVEKFGGLEVVDKGLLPMGVLKALRSRKVTWQMVL